MKKNILCFLTVLLCTQTFITAIGEAHIDTINLSSADDAIHRQEPEEAKAEAERQEEARAEEAERQEAEAERKRQALLNQNEQPTTAKNPSGGPENQSGGTATPVGIDATNREPKALGDGRRNFDDLGNKKNPESPAERAEAKRIEAERAKAEAKRIEAERAKAEAKRITLEFKKRLTEINKQINDTLNGRCQI